MIRLIGIRLQPSWQGRRKRRRVVIQSGQHRARQSPSRQAEGDREGEVENRNKHCGWRLGGPS